MNWNKATNNAIYTAAGFSVVYGGLLPLVLAIALWRNQPAMGMLTLMAIVVWPILTPLQVFVQQLPKNFRKHASGQQLATDKWTSFVPVVGCVLALVVIWLSPHPAGLPGWMILIQGTLGAMAEFAIMRSD